MIQVQSVRVSGFRGLSNIEVNLEKTTVLIGMNNAGKTSFLKALQIAFGDSRFVNDDDFHIDASERAVEEIIIDVLLVPVDADGKRSMILDRSWGNVFRDDSQTDAEGNEYIAFRTTVSRVDDQRRFSPDRVFLKEWVEFSSWKSGSHVGNAGVSSRTLSDTISFLFQDAQRDITEDLKLRTSLLGKVLSKVEYEPGEIEALQSIIDDLNSEAVEKSVILRSLRNHLSKLGDSIGTHAGKTEITPFAKKVRDLTKGMRLNYGEGDSSFSMEYHGMGTRSWVSLLVIRSYVKILEEERRIGRKPFLPILALEEPEAHLHPNAQRQLYHQMSQFPGQVIISTHSPYVAAQADLTQLRSFYKGTGTAIVGELASFEDDEQKRRIEREVMNTRGELLFSRMLVMFEGETEEQALPLFFTKVFGKTPFDCGVNFVGVSGSGNYKSFIAVAEAFHIPWLIFSDGEVAAVEAVKSAIKLVFDSQADVMFDKNVFVLPDRQDYEGYLLSIGYQREIEQGIEDVKTIGWIDNYIRRNNGQRKKQQRTDRKCDHCNQFIFEGDFRDYNGTDGRIRALGDILDIRELKTKIAVPIAEKIAGRPDELAIPPKVRELLQKIIVTCVNREEVDV